MNEKYKLLSKVNSPIDLKKLDIQSLDLLGDEIADYIHETITKLGGHYASPLGVIDLTLAMHYVYSTPKDKMIWDVGHQAYPHKILTGRKKEFSNIRQYGGISGFLKRDESEHDMFGAGHASTSISAALGFAHSRDKNNQDHNVMCVIGDGAMTGGMAYEALNNLGYHRTQLTVILNDNSFSISESVGGLSKYLTKITTHPQYNKLRDKIKKITEIVPGKSNFIQKLLKKTEEGMKATLTPGGLFEELGVRYIGPIDGHDIPGMIKIFESIKDIRTPLLLHVYTDKSKRINESLGDDAIKYYSLSPSKPKDNSLSIDYTFSKVFGISILNLAKNINFNCITAAMKLGTGLSDFAKDYKDRYIDVGIAEEHALTYGAGLSAAGERVIVAIYSTFMQRSYDHIIHDIALQSLPITLCMDRAGLVGEDGPTHHGVFDISFMRQIPNVIVTSPKDGYELHDLLYTSLKSDKIFSIRYGKFTTEYSSDYKPKLLEIGTWINEFDGKNIAILAVGNMVNTALNVASTVKNKYNENITVINCRFIKPLDTNMLIDICKNHSHLITMEEGIKIGGFGSAVMEFLNDENLNINLKILAIPDSFVDHGARDKLLSDLKLDEASLLEEIKNIIK